LFPPQPHLLPSGEKEEMRGTPLYFLSPHGERIEVRGNKATLVDPCVRRGWSFLYLACSVLVQHLNYFSWWVCHPCLPAGRREPRKLIIPPRPL
jgi:hypothetical protein